MNILLPEEIPQGLYTELRDGNCRSATDVGKATCRGDSKMTPPGKGGVCVYADIGIGDAEEMLVKAQLATKMS